MKTAILLTAALAASAALAEPAPTPAPTAPGAGRAYDPNEMVCRRIQESGSRLRAARMCATRAQWEQQRRLDRQNAEHAQSQRNPHN